MSMRTSSFPLRRPNSSARSQSSWANRPSSKSVFNVPALPCQVRPMKPTTVTYVKVRCSAQATRAGPIECKLVRMPNPFLFGRGARLVDHASHGPPRLCPARQSDRCHLRPRNKRTSPNSPPSLAHRAATRTQAPVAQPTVPAPLICKAVGVAGQPHKSSGRTCVVGSPHGSGGTN